MLQSPDNKSEKEAKSQKHYEMNFRVSTHKILGEERIDIEKEGKKPALALPKNYKLCFKIYFNTPLCLHCSHMKLQINRERGGDTVAPLKLGGISNLVG